MILDTHLEDALRLYFPDIARDIDWRIDPESLEQELRPISVASDVGTKRVDKLVKVQLRAGDPLLLLIHIEVQSTQRSDFENRMFVYHYRIYDQLKAHPVSTAILLDDNPSWKPERYLHERYESKIQLDFRTIKLLDYSEDELLASSNPFALVTLAQLLEAKQGKTDDARYETKFRLMRLLFEKGYDCEKIINLLKFIDWILRLPTALNQKLRVELEATMPKETKMYITSFERIAKEEGVEIGLEKAVFLLIENKFETIPSDLREAIEALDTEAISKLIIDIQTAHTIDDIWGMLG